MANYNPPAQNAAFITYIKLEDAANPGSFKINPTLAAGDFKVSIDDGAENNLTNPASVSPAGSAWVKLSLTAAEMNGSNIKISGTDQTSPKEWSDFALTIITTEP